MEKEILLTITMLVSDREETIEKCMESLVHLRDTVPSELIVVDTAGNQNCMDIVRRYTDNIVRFEWCNDFGAARNAGLARAKGKWIMYLDDDEWFENTEELEHFFQSGTYRNYNAATYKTRNYSNFQGTTWDDSDAIRLVKREKTTHFHGKVHEYLKPLMVPIYYTNDYVHHYGYVYKSKQEWYRHVWRNLNLLLDIHKKEPDNYHVASQLIQEYKSVGEVLSASQICKTMRERADFWNKTFIRYTTYIAATEVQIYLQQRDYCTAYEVGVDILTHKGISVLARGCLCNHVVSACSHMEKYEEALKYANQYLQVFKEWKDYPDKRLIDAFSVLSRYLEPVEANRIKQVKLHINCLLKEYGKASDNLLDFDWKDKALQIQEPVVADIVTVIEKTDYVHVFPEVLSVLLKDPDLKKALYVAVDQSEEQEKLMAYFAELPLEDLKLCRYRLVHAGYQGDVALAIPALEKMRQESYPFFLQSMAYWESLLKLNIAINSYMPDLSIYEWMETTGRFWMISAPDVCEKAYLCLTKGLEKTDLRYIYVSGLFMEKKLLAKEKALLDAEASGTSAPEAPRIISLKRPLPDPEKTWDELYQLSQYWVTCAASLYREDIFMGDLISAIPPAYQFGWYIMQANALKQENHDLFLQKVADAAKAYPALKELCKLVIKGI